MEKPSRIRLTFESPKILSKSQLLRGLNNSWLFLNSEINTISDLASHVCKIFKLSRSCPNGIVLYMGDFVLPQFESVHLLKDNDIIRVRKKDVYHQHYIKDSGVEEEEHAICTVNFLAIKEFGENSSEHKRNDDEHLFTNNNNAINSRTCSKSKKKRKQIDDTQVLKKKKLKAEIKKPTTTCDKDEDTSKGDFSHFVQKDTNSPKNHKEKNKEEVPKSPIKKKRKKKSQSVSPQEESVSTQSTEKPTIDRSQDTTKKLPRSKKHLNNNDKIPEDKEKSNAIIASPPQVCVNEKINSGSKDNRSVQIEENIEGNTYEPHADDSAPKAQSRSSRRKKAKRKWAREMKAQEEQKIQNQGATELNHRELSELQEAEQNTELEKDMVPIVIKPGHIRFRSLDEGESEEHPQAQDLMGTFQWNGTTSKKKGQKWGMEKTKGYFDDVNGYKEHMSDTMSKCNNSFPDKEQFNVKENTMNGSDGYIVSKHLSNGMSNGSVEKSFGNTVHEKTRMDVVIDFEKLLALTRTPQVGDVLAYRVIELSSSWCPEVSPFRVGLVTSYDPASLIIVLDGLPEYPITLDKGLEEEEDVTDAVTSLYDEDGSLQISYSQLIDVRLLKASDLEAAISNSPAEDTVMQEDHSSELAVNGNIALEPVSQPTVEKENDADSGWEEIRKELEKKKAELQKKSTTASPSLSYRAIRKSAVGPTLAYLRKTNNEQSDLS